MALAVDFEILRITSQITFEYVKKLKNRMRKNFYAFDSQIKNIYMV